MEKVYALADSRVKLTMHTKTTAKPRATVNTIMRPKVYVKAMPKPYVPAKVVVMPHVCSYMQ